MPNLFYFDTAIWIDFFEKREERGEKALKLIIKILIRKDIILYSDLVTEELKGMGYKQNDIYEIFKIVKPDSIRKIHVYKKQLGDAKKLAFERDIPKRDVLHAMLARDNNAILITRDWHFQKIKDISIPHLPEEFIES